MHQTEARSRMAARASRGSEGAGGDDWLRGGHGEEMLDGGAGSDVVDGGKGDDTLSYTLGENASETDFYDGGKGVDTLQINLSADELTQEMWDELQDLREWIAETADPKRSESHSFSDSSARSAKHPIYETSFGLTIRNIESLEVEVEGYGPVDLDGGLPDFDLVPDPDPEPEPTPDPEPAPEPTADPVVIDFEAEATTDPGPSTVDTVASGDGEILVREGDQIAAGQVLIRLDDTTPRTSLELLRSCWMVANALEARLEAARLERPARGRPHLHSNPDCLS